MNHFLSALHQGFKDIFRSRQLRTIVCVWCVIAGICVVLANTLAKGI